MNTCQGGWILGRQPGNPTVREGWRQAQGLPDCSATQRKRAAQLGGTSQAAARSQIFGVGLRSAPSAPWHADQIEAGPHPAGEFLRGEAATGQAVCRTPMERCRARAQPIERHLWRAATAVSVAAKAPLARIATIRWPEGRHIQGSPAPGTPPSKRRQENRPVSDCPAAKLWLPSRRIDNPISPVGRALVAFLTEHPSPG